MINFSQGEWWERSDAAADLYERGFVRFEDFGAAAAQTGVAMRENTNQDTKIPNGIILRLLDTAVYTAPVNDAEGNPRKNERGLEVRQSVLLTKPCGKKHTEDEEFALPISILDKVVFEHKEDLKTLVKRHPATGDAAKEYKSIYSKKQSIANMVAQCTKFETLPNEEKATYPKYAIKITVLPMVMTRNFERTALCEDFPVQIDWVTKAEADASLVSTDELDLIDKTKSSIDIPSSIKRIRREAFKGCTSFTSINIPDSVKTIRSNAFVCCIYEA